MRRLEDAPEPVKDYIAEMKVEALTDECSRVTWAQPSPRLRSMKTKQSAISRASIRSVSRRAEAALRVPMDCLPARESCQPQRPLTKT